MGSFVVNSDEINLCAKSINSKSWANTLNRLIGAIRSANIKFPYKQQFIRHSPEKLMENLRNYQPQIIEREYILNGHKYFKSGIIKPEFEGHPIIFLNDDSKTYDDVNILSDVFSEKYRVKCHRYDFLLSPEEYFADDKNLFHLLKSIYFKGENITWFTIREELYHKVPECTNFKLTLALTILKYFRATKILDISAGWGDRLIAAIALPDLQYYHGTDPNVCLQECYRHIIETFVPVESRTKYRVQPLPFEDATITHTYDCIFTSPPYYNLENYNIDTATGTKSGPQSIEKYQDRTTWFNEFLCRSLSKAWNHLEVGGTMIISIEDIIKEWGPDRGCTLYTEDTVLFCNSSLPGARYLGVIGHTNVGKGRTRPLFVWRKQGDSLSP